MSFSVTSACGSKLSDNFSSNSTPPVDYSMFDDIALYQPMIGAEDSDTSLFGAEDNGLSLLDKFIPDAVDKNYSDSDLKQTPQVVSSKASSFSSSISSSVSTIDERTFLQKMQSALGIVANTSFFSSTTLLPSVSEIQAIETSISNKIDEDYAEDYDLRECLLAAIVDYCEMKPVEEICIKYSEVKERIIAYIMALNFFYKKGLDYRRSEIFDDACKGVNTETFRFLTHSIDFHEKQDVYARVLAK